MAAGRCSPPSTHQVRISDAEARRERLPSARPPLLGLVDGVLLGICTSRQRPSRQGGSGALPAAWAARTSSEGGPPVGLPLRRR